jgi:hypothetical protein
MKRLKKLIALTAVMTLFAGQVQGQGDVYYGDAGAAYEDSSDNYLSVALPVGALVVAAIIIATTNRHHHHHSSPSSATTTTTTTHAHSSSF